YGFISPQVEAEILALFSLLEEIVQSNFARNCKDTLLLITADHGHSAVSSKDTIFLDERLPDLTRMTRTTRDGQLLASAGGPRDMFLYLKEEHLEEARGMLSASLQDRAKVYPTSQLLHEGYFGPNPSERLRERLGNLVVLASSDQLVWWRGK